MFRSCIVQLNQNPNPGNTVVTRWVRVRLNRARNLANPAEPYKWASQEWHWIGQWEMEGTNSENFVDPGTIGIAGSPVRENFWVYNINEKELAIVQIQNVGGGGLTYGETVQKMTQPSCLFYDAKMTPRGFEPLRPGYSGGFLKYNSRVMQQGRFVWEWDRDFR